MAHENRLGDTSHTISIGARVCYCVITLCLTVLYLVGILICALACMPILCVLPVLYMGLKLVEVSRRYLKGMALALRERKSSTHWENVD